MLVTSLIITYPVLKCIEGFIGGLYICQKVDCQVFVKKLFYLLFITSSKYVSGLDLSNGSLAHIMVIESVLPILVME